MASERTPITPTYKHEPRCTICTETDRSGEKVRDRVDAMGAKGYTYKDIQKELADMGVNTTTRTISNHFHNHSPFVLKAKKLGTRGSRRLQVKIRKEHREASEALQRIITIGDGMVQNWVEGGEGPKMPVSERLYIEALKEEGRRGDKTIVDAEMELMDEALFDKIEEANDKTPDTEVVQGELAEGEE